LKGWYGDHPNCLQCPVDKLSSPRTVSGGPNSNCKCPNETIDQCFDCSNVCRPFNPKTGVCTPICSHCRIITRGGVQYPSNCDDTKIKSATELKAAGKTLGELKEAGFTARELKVARFTLGELKEVGFTAGELKEERYTADQLKLSGFKITQLKAAGFTVDELKLAGFTVSQIIAA
jgi:hypothetical protein